MPIYEYTCDSCDEITEALQKFSDPPIKTCAYCGGKLSKKISNSTFILKGSGWYVTDYGGKKNGSGDKDKVNLKGDGENGKGTKVDTAKEAKPESSSEKPKESKSEKSASTS